MKCYGYIRVSTADQADSGLGLQAQRDAILREYEAKWKPQGYEWGGVYEDAAVSGKKPFLSRPSGLRLSTASDRGDILLFSKLDRAFRSVMDSLQTIEVWRARKVRCVFLDFNLDTETPVGEFVLTVMSAFAQMERRRIGERTREGLLVAKAKGVITGVGSDTLLERRRTDGGKIVRTVRPQVFALGLKIVEWRNRGISWTAIYQTLKYNGVTRPPKSVVNTIKANPWWSRTSLTLLHRSTLKVQHWLNEGKVKWPAGWQKPTPPTTKELDDIKTQMEAT